MCFQHNHFRCLNEAAKEGEDNERYTHHKNAKNSPLRLVWEHFSHSKPSIAFCTAGTSTGTDRAAWPFDSVQYVCLRAGWTHRLHRCHSTNPTTSAIAASVALLLLPLFSVDSKSTLIELLGGQFSALRPYRKRPSVWAAPGRFSKKPHIAAIGTKRSPYWTAEELVRNL